MATLIIYTGLDICLGKPLDDTLLRTIRKEVQGLSDSLEDFIKETNNQVRVTIELFKAEFDKDLAVVQEKQFRIEERCDALQHSQDVLKEEVDAKDKEQKQVLKKTELQLQMKQEQIESFCKSLEVKSSAMEKDLETLTTTICTITGPEDPEKIVFDAPERNNWFTGRKREMETLENCLTFKSDKELKIAAICGLGGCGKTTLAASFAWKRKSEYQGGVFWFSMEDDRKFENTVNDLALRLEILSNTFDLTLTKVLTWISQRRRPWLLVLDDVDQLNFSDQMRKVLSGRWKRQATGHLLVTTRREKREMSQHLDLDPSCCVHACSFSTDEAKNFLIARISVDQDTAHEDELLTELVRELGCLPLALEQAGAHIEALQCRIDEYLEEYKSQRLTLLRQYPAKPSWEYESQSRLAVHTTWLLNFEYVKKSAHGELASRFVQAAGFLAPEEIQEELINRQLLSVGEGQSDRSSNLPLLKHHIVEVLARFSLFQRHTSGSLSLHRLVQEVIRNRMTIEEKASSLLIAIRLLHSSFQECPSPDRILTDVAGSVQEQASSSVAEPSMFHLWSKLTSHAFELHKHVISLLDQQHITREVKAIVLTRETSRVMYENALQLSVLGHQEEAKKAERFALQILNSTTSDRVALRLEDLRKLFPHTLPLSQMLQKTILYSSRPLTRNEKFGKSRNCESGDTDALRLQGNSFFKDGCFTKAVETYTKAIEASIGMNNLDPRLLNNRATAYLKLQKFEECLQDAEEYIKIKPECWKGYSRRALALNGIGRKRPALCSAAIAYYSDPRCCRCYEPFRNVFKDLDGHWDVVDSSEALQRSLMRNQSQSTRKDVLLIRHGQYEMFDRPNVSNNFVETTLAALCEKSCVILTCGMVSLRKQCFFRNITISTKFSILVEPDGKVEFENCSFRNTASNLPVITIGGVATFLECAVKDSEGSGIGVQGSASFAAVVKSHISGNGKMDPYAYGIRVFNGGSLLVHESHIYGNTRGVWIDEGPRDGVPANKVLITGSEIYDNKYEGVVVGAVPKCLESSPMVIIRKNKIFHNGTFGIRAALNINNALVEENTISENYWWGVCVHTDSGGLYRHNEICNNKMGGVLVSRRSPRKPPCVVENNFIHDNCGPAFHEGLRAAEQDSFPLEVRSFFTRQINIGTNSVHDQIMATDVSLPNSVPSVFNENHCVRNDSGQKTFEAADVTYCAFCLRRDVELKNCTRCMTARYCGKECQKIHWGSHKHLCKAVGEKNAIEVSIPDVELSMIPLRSPSLKSIQPGYASSPPRDGSRFIVKIQTVEDSGPLKANLDMRGFESDDRDPNKATMILYDRSRQVNFYVKFKPQIYHLIMECGMMGMTMSLTKELHFWAAFKDDKTLRIFTHEFPPVQDW